MEDEMTVIVNRSTNILISNFYNKIYYNSIRCINFNYDSIYIILNDNSVVMANTKSFKIDYLKKTIFNIVEKKKVELDNISFVGFRIHCNNCLGSGKIDWIQNITKNTAKNESMFVKSNDVIIKTYKMNQQIRIQVKTILNNKISDVYCPQCNGVGLKSLSDERVVLDNIKYSQIVPNLDMLFSLIP